MERAKKSSGAWAIVAGVALGLGFVAFDVVSESRLATGTLTGPLAGAHTLVDRSFPIVAGGLLGLSLYQLRLRARLREAEQTLERAEALRLRLLKVERDQAVWVLVAAVLHELNNPLHALGLLLDELRESDADPALRRDLGERARAQVSRALGHLATLRSMNGVGEPDVQPVAIAELARALARDAESLTWAERIRVVVDAPGEVRARADAAYVRTILENLLDNSLHALRAGSGGSVSIRVARERERAVVRVEDDGPPLEAEVRPVLFDPLRTTKNDGLGLGLPIARALARALSGDLSLEPGSGKVFRLELPLGEGGQE